MPDHALKVSTIEPAANRHPKGSGDHFLDRLGPPGRLIRAYPWLFGAAVLFLLSYGIVRWANTRPGYDPYGWLDWGQLLVHGKLDTNGAPSWKPLPFLFTIPYALLGRHTALWLWMTTAVAVALSGGVFAWRIAWKLTDAPPERRYAGYAAGVFAVGSLFGIVEYTHYFLSDQSDPMIVSLCLAGVDCWLCGRHRWGLAALWLGALGRPEVWPFLLLYSVWAWRHEPATKKLIIGAWVALVFLWYGVPGLTSRTPFVAQDNAADSPRIIHGNKITGTIDRFKAEQTWSIWLLGVAGFTQAVLRRRHARNGFVIVLGLCTIVWMLVEIAFALHGFPAVPRYMFEATAMTGVIGAVAIGRLLVDLPEYIARRAPKVSARAAGYALAAVVVVFAAGLLPVAKARYDTEHKDLLHERDRTTEINKLIGVMDVLGGPQRILDCGVPYMPIEYQSIFAYYADIKTTIMYVTKKGLAKHPRTTVDMYPLSTGWHVFPAQVTTASESHCHGLRTLYTG